MKTFSGHPAVQVEWELEQLLALVRREAPSSYLEIGVARGDTFHAIVSAMPPGSRAVAIDYPEQAWGLRGSLQDLKAAARDLRRRGYDVTLIAGDSQSRVVIDQVRGPFDLVLIDGDHTAEGVAADWINYGADARVVAFHDIADTMRPNRKGERIEVPEFWRALREGRRVEEFIAPGSTMGIGVVYQC